MVGGIKEIDIKEMDNIGDRTDIGQINKMQTPPSFTIQLYTYVTYTNVDTSTRGIKEFDYLKTKDKIKLNLNIKCK